jgi:hypothetical protein
MDHLPGRKNLEQHLLQGMIREIEVPLEAVPISNPHAIKLSLRKLNEMAEFCLNVA